MSQFDRAGSVTGINCALGSYEKFQPGFRGEKKVKDPGDEFWRQIRETEQIGPKVKIFVFRYIFKHR